jgi:hypothetical protein
MRHLAFVFLFAPYTVLCYGQMDAPLKVTMCELYEHPEQYAGKMVEVRASLMGSDLALDDFSNQNPCPAYMKVHLEFPKEVKPAPGFDVTHNQAYDELFQKMRLGMGVEATYVGRFDPAFVWREHKRVRVGESTAQGYGKKGRYDGRIVLREVSDVVAHSMPRK